MQEDRPVRGEGESSKEGPSSLASGGSGQTHENPWADMTAAENAAAAEAQQHQSCVDPSYQEIWCDRRNQWIWVRNAIPVPQEQTWWGSSWSWNDTEASSYQQQ